MPKGKPFFSVVVPTRNRPELIRYCLESLTCQTFSDFEVIVSDNYTGKPCKAVFDRFADDRFQYVTPPSPLTMHDNWEFACAFSRGEFTTVLIDKTILRPSALQIVNSTLNTMPAELLSWWNEGYILTEEERNYDKGKYMPTYTKRSPYHFDSQEELAKRFSFDTRRGNEGIRYHWGKICFGAYRQDLIRRIKQRMGRLFYPVSPDYTSMIAALADAKSAVDIGQPLIISMLTKISNGKLAADRDDYALNFIKDIDSSLKILEDVPLKGLYTSTHNLIAKDYLLMREKIGESMQGLYLNITNLILRAKEDLDLRKVWSDDRVRKEQYGVWARYFSELAPEERINIYWQLSKSKIMNDGRMLIGAARNLAAKLPGLRRARRAYVHARSLQYPETSIYGNILEAAKYADKYYGEFTSL